MDLRSEAGNAALILALGIAGVGGFLVKKNYDQVNVKLKEFKLDKTMNSNEQLGQSSFHATSSFLKFINGMPAVYPDPYLGDSINLVDLAKGAGAKPWWIKNGVLNIKLTESKSYGNPQFNEIFKGNDPKLTDTVNVRLLSAHPSNLHPYYIEYIDVETSIKNDAKADGLSRTVKKRARLKLPPPPDPVCTIVPKDKKVDKDEVSLSIETSGVSLAAYIQFDRKKIRVGGIPTKANSIKSYKKNIGTKTVSGLVVGKNNIEGYVLNVMNQKVKCSSAVVEREAVDIHKCNYRCTSLARNDSSGYQPASGGVAGWTMPKPYPARWTSMPYRRHVWEWMYRDNKYPSRLVCVDVATLKTASKGDLYAFDPANNCKMSRKIGTRSNTHVPPVMP